MSNEETEFWAAYRKDQKARRAARLPACQREILDLREQGRVVKRLTAYQFRVDGAIDLYPIHRRFHVLKTGKRGTYKNALSFCNKILDKPSGKV